MSDTTFTPVLFMKEGCPFCLKVQIFLLEAGLLDKVKLRTFAADTPEEQAIRAELAPHFEKLSFPTVQLSPDTYLGESDEIIAHFANQAQVDPADLPTFRAYSEGVLTKLQALYRENITLKKQIA